MGADKEIIVALEFGTSAIQGIAGRKNPDGTVQILAIEQECTADAIQRGVIYNIDKTTQAIKSIVERIDERLGIRIGRAYVGVGGQSLHSVSNVIPRDFEAKLKITPELIDNLKDNNASVEYSDSQILDVIPQEYIIGNRSIADPIGVQTERLEARFVNVVARNTLLENIEKCMRQAGIDIVENFIAPLALADAMLTDSEKRSGCALVDFGAGTTTVTVYRGNLLRHLAVIPLGGQNINNDMIAAHQLETDEAEALKRKYGVAYVSSESDKPQQLDISNDRKLSENELLNIIGARQEEIIKNVWNQIEPMKEHLLAGIVITGGASQLKDMPEAIKHFTEFQKVRAAKSLITTADVANDVVTPQGNSVDTLIALLMHGNSDCLEEVEETVEDEVHEGEPTVAEQEPAQAAAETVTETEKEEKPEEPAPAKPKKHFSENLHRLWRTFTKTFSEDDGE